MQVVLEAVQALHVTALQVLHVTRVTKKKKLGVQRMDGATDVLI